MVYTYFTLIKNEPVYLYKGQKKRFNLFPSCLIREEYLNDINESGFNQDYIETFPSLASDIHYNIIVFRKRPYRKYIDLYNRFNRIPERVARQPEVYL